MASFMGLSSLVKNKKYCRDIIEIIVEFLQINLGNYYLSVSQL